MIIEIFIHSLASKISSIIEKGSTTKALAVFGLSFISTGIVIYFLCLYFNFEQVVCCSISISSSLIISIVLTIIFSQIFFLGNDRYKTSGSSLIIDTINTGLVHVFYSTFLLLAFIALTISSYLCRPWNFEDPLIFGSFIVSSFIYFIWSIPRGVVSVEFVDDVVIKTLISKKYFKLNEVKLLINNEKNINYPYIIVIGKKENFRIPIKKDEADLIKDYILQ